jgi:hypothetical protein
MFHVLNLLSNLFCNTNYFPSALSRMSPCYLAKPANERSNVANGPKILNYAAV